jgi:hypothetical protein
MPDGAGKSRRQNAPRRHRWQATEDNLAGRLRAVYRQPQRSLRLAVQDVALSRRKQGFESPRERHLNQYFKDCSRRYVRFVPNKNPLSVEKLLVRAPDPEAKRARDAWAEKIRQPIRAGGKKSGHLKKRNGSGQATIAPACAIAMPTPKKIVLPMIAPKTLLPKVVMSSSLNSMVEG